MLLYYTVGSMYSNFILFSINKIRELMNSKNKFSLNFMLEVNAEEEVFKNLELN